MLFCNFINSRYWNFVEIKKKMLLNSNNQNNLNFAFLIPHVSKLLIYKDNWNKSEVMRKVIAEVLKARLFTKLSVGSQAIDYCNEYDPSCNDCAIINISLSGINNLSYTPSSVEKLFVDEISNPSNHIQWSSTRLSIEKNVSCLDVSIDVAHISVPVSEDDIQAA